MPVHRSKSIRIGSLVYDSDMIEDHTFIDCELVGPAVIFPMENDTFSNCGWNVDSIMDLFWEVDPKKRNLVGVIGVRNCRFEGCTFTRIGWAGPPDAYAQLVQDIPMATPPA